MSVPFRSGLVVILAAITRHTGTRAGRGQPLRARLPSTLDKAYLELNNASHSAPTSANGTVAKYSIAWPKRFIDDDTRYERCLRPVIAEPGS